MKKYYLHDGAGQEGPFDIDELKAKNITADTHIWYEGIDNWTTAGQIAELKEILPGKKPPPFNPNIEAQAPAFNQIIEKEKIKYGKIIAVIAIIIIGIAAIQYMINKNDSTENAASKNPGTYEQDEASNPKTYEQKVMSVEKVERSQPTKFLKAGGTYKTTLFKKVKISGTITNSATVASYKDAVVKVTYYSKTKAVLHEKEFPINETFPPTSTKNFEWKLDNYVDVSTVKWKIISAVAK